ncbi:MAG: type II toxin-antitoxin system ParD family antitoxin [Desulfoferrobacter sp.]
MPSSYAIGSHFERFIKRQVESGRYSSASEVIRDALRLLERREELRQAQIQAIRTQIQEGRDSGASVPGNEVLDRLEAKYSALPPRQ